MVGQIGHIAFENTLAVDAEWATYVDTILKILCRYAPRLEFLYIGYPSIRSVILPELGELPLLRSFHFKPLWSQHYCPFTSAPRLVDLRWLSSRTVIERRFIPWHQLTHLEIASRQASHTIIELIQNCPELLEFIANLGIDYDHGSDTLLPCRPRVLHTRLYTLNMSGGIREYLLDSLILPALKDLSLFNSGDNPIETTQQHLLLLFSRLKCMLDKLTLDNYAGEASTFLKFLQHGSLSTLTELKVINWDGHRSLTDDTLTQLTDIPSGTTKLLLPKLSHLRLEKCVSASPGMLGQMIYSRCCPSKKENRLKSFVFITRYTYPEDRDYINITQQQGLKWHIRIIMIQLSDMD
ncbi:hypothetical protein AX17_006782 [Amanita inopinata Kibby_2008]|nr:hypothetical protein AX17_006782 [Amanita inopinata Kibby_2008]